MTEVFNSKESEADVFQFLPVDEFIAVEPCCHPLTPMSQCREIAV